MKKRTYHVYIMTNNSHYVLYTGVTNNLPLRVYQHKQKIGGEFTGKYNIDKLVYCEEYDDINRAIAREKQIKAGSRKKKEALINGLNPGWKDLSAD